MKSKNEILDKSLFSWSFYIRLIQNQEIKWCFAVNHIFWSTHHLGRDLKILHRKLLNETWWKDDLFGIYRVNNNRDLYELLFSSFNALYACIALVQIWRFLYIWVLYGEFFLHFWFFGPWSVGFIKLFFL